MKRMRPRLRQRKAMADPGGAEFNFQLIAGTTAENLSSMRTRSAGPSTEHGDVLFGVDSERERHLLVPIPVDAEFSADRDSRGVHLERRLLIGNGGVDLAFIDVACKLPQLERLFSSVVDEIIVSLNDDATAPAKTCQAVIRRWRELLTRAPGELMDENSLLGLFGELVVLRDASRINADGALKMWCGWEKDKVDFRYASDAMEVKASLAREGKLVTIHGLYQLERPAGGSLHLVVIWVDRATESGLSVPDLVTEIVDLGVDEVELLRRLGQSGYNESHSVEYADIRFEIRERTIYQVDEDFPRITPSMLVKEARLERLQSVRYRVDLADLPEVPDEHYLALLESMVAG